jgi:hypothetical protein
MFCHVAESAPCGTRKSLSGLTALTAEFTVGEGKLMTHDGLRLGNGKYCTLRLFLLYPVSTGLRKGRYFPSAVFYCFSRYNLPSD